MTRFSALRWLQAAIVIVFGMGVAMTAEAKTAYDFSFETIDGGPLPMSQYKGKTVLVVNTASFCGFTPQYEQLESLWKAKRDKGLIVLGVPSNDFGSQEPGSAKEIKEFCESKYDVDFPLASKVKVKGPDAHPFYKWAADSRGEPKWNFHKYLLNSKGELVAAFDSKTRPDSPDVLAAIDKSLATR
jgi:glutathione peroxidase